jgi:hypothetical protein
MSKVQDMARARADGLDMALRIVRAAQKEGKDPAEAIAKELRFRGYSGVAGNLTEAEYSHDTRQIKLYTIMTLKAVALISAWEEFGFEKSRLDRLDAQMEIYAQALVKEEITWTDVLEMLETKMQRKVNWMAEET